LCINQLKYTSKFKVIAIVAIYGGFWTGLHDKKDEMAFEWSDGMKVSYTTWADREPNNMGRDGQDCVMMKLLVK
jgi:hypothetical protein